MAWLAGSRQVREAGGLDPAALQHFNTNMFGGSPPEAGERVVNPSLGRSLGMLASQGCSGFYGASGPVDEALRYARDHGSPLRPYGNVSLPREQWQATWQKPVSLTQRTRARMPASPRSNPGALEQCDVFGPAQSSQAASALDITAVMMKAGVDPVAEPERYLHALVSAKRAVYASTRVNGGDASDGRTFDGCCFKAAKAGRRPRSTSKCEPLCHQGPDGAQHDNRHCHKDALSCQACNFSGFLANGIPRDLDNNCSDSKLPMNYAAVAARVRSLYESKLAASTARDVQQPAPDTEGISVTDRTGMVIAWSQSIGGLFGSGLCPPQAGFCLQARGYGFSMTAKEDHPNSYYPGRRPAHTLAPLLVACKIVGNTSSPLAASLDTTSRRLWLGVATKGGDRVPYVVAHFLSNFLAFVGRGSSFANSITTALDMPRIRDRALSAPTPHNPDGLKEHRPEQLDAVEVELGGILRGATNGSGYVYVLPSNVDYEDSGFAILHVCRCTLRSA